MLRLDDATLLKSDAWIDGQWVGGAARFAVTNPATGATIAEVPDLGRVEAEQAIAAADAALAGWRALAAKERSRTIRRWYDLIVAHGEDLARIITAEQGKPLAEARGEIGYASSFVEWFAEEAKRVAGDVLAHPDSANRIVVLKQPVGVCAAITPWNFPAAMITRKAAPALAAGCTMIVKPAAQTPLTALALAELAMRAGVPAGVFNIVTCASSNTPELGATLTGSAVVRKLTFTGSTGVGRMLMRDSASTIKKISLELGGNASLLVFDDVDLDAAVAGVMTAKFRNTGQSCIAANRIFVQASIHDAFTEKLAAAVAALTVGPGDRDGVAIGPLIDMAAVAKVESHVADAIEKGAKLVAGGVRHPSGGTFFSPTILSGVTREMLVFGDETFGPIAPLIRFETEAEAVAMANDSPFGLASYVFTHDLARTWRVTEALEAGMVGVNTGMISNEVAPFGGIKQSGLGREGSRYGIEEYLETKYVCLGGVGQPL